MEVQSHLLLNDDDGQNVKLFAAARVANDTVEDLLYDRLDTFIPSLLDRVCQLRGAKLITVDN